MANVTFNQFAAFSIITRGEIAEHLSSADQIKELWSTFYGKLPQIRKGKPVLDQSGRVVAERLGKDHMILSIIQDSNTLEGLGFVAKITIEGETLRAWAANSRDVTIRQFELIDGELTQKSCPMVYLDDFVGVGIARFAAYSEPVIVKFGNYQPTKALGRPDVRLYSFVLELEPHWAFNNKTLLSQHYVFVENMEVNTEWAAEKLRSNEYQVLLALENIIQNRNPLILNQTSGEDKNKLFQETLAFQEEAIRFLKNQASDGMNLLRIATVPLQPGVSPICMNCYSRVDLAGSPGLDCLVEDSSDLKAGCVSMFEPSRQSWPVPGSKDGMSIASMQLYVSENKYQEFRRVTSKDAVFFYRSDETPWEGFSRYLACQGLDIPVGLLQSTHTYDETAEVDRYF